MTSNQAQALKKHISDWAIELGFAQVGVADLKLDASLKYLDRWLDNAYQGDMGWMSDRRDLRAKPETLVPGTLRVISLRMNYLPPDTEPLRILEDKSKAYISRYALGRDYHKLIRNRLAKLADKIKDWASENLPNTEASQRVFVDSAPVLEKPFAEKSGLGWIGKNTLLLNREEGSWFFLGEIYTNLELPVDSNPQEDKCGKCKACLNICPTDAFPEPYVLDARKCISYLTIEHKGAIPTELRKPMGNRVFGCDDCQLICPWNRYARPTDEQDFRPRHDLNNRDLTELFAWDEETFLRNTAGSPIRRVGFERWQRNLAVGLGNGPAMSETIQSLKQHSLDSPLVQEHVDWAVKQLSEKGS